MTSRMEKMMEMVGMLTLAELDRRQRDSAPTLRDLPVTAQPKSSCKNMTDAGNADGSGFRALKHH